MNATDISNMPAGLLIPNYLVHSCIYYEELGEPLISDADYDELARRIHTEWDHLYHIHKHLIERDALLTSGYYIQFTNMIRECAKQRVRESQPKSYLAESELMAAEKKRLNSRSKGQRGEREIIDLLQPHLNEVSNYNQVPAPFLQRNQMQTHAGGYDIVGLPGFAFEVKRVEKDQDGKILGWWRQCCGQAKAGEEPVLFYRRNGQAWRVMLFTRLDLDAKRRYKIPSVIGMPEFIFYLKARVHCLQLAQKKAVDA